MEWSNFNCLTLHSGCWLGGTAGHSKLIRSYLSARYPVTVSHGDIVARRPSISLSSHDQVHRISMDIGAEVGVALHFRSYFRGAE